MAGVRMASAKNSAAPAMPRAKTAPVRRPMAFCASASMDRMPPSPLLSARSRNRTYFSVTIRISAQSSSETTPRTSARVTPSAAASRSASRSA